jgi:uncharacterized membrane protein YgaE (UPF0421/DUF939 family)
MQEKDGRVFVISKTDLEIAIATGICLLMAKVIPEYQAMTACIATLLCVQEDIKAGWKASIIRLIVTAIGGLVAVLVILVDNMSGNTWLFMAMVMLGLLLTFFGCKVARVPLFNTRIGGVTFILVVLTKTKTAGIYYTLFRLLSTLYGVIAVMLVAAVFAFFENIKNNKFVLKKK